MAIEIFFKPEEVTSGLLKTKYGLLDISIYRGAQDAYLAARQAGKEQGAAHTAASEYAQKRLGRPQGAWDYAAAAQDTVEPAFKAKAPTVMAPEAVRPPVAPLPETLPAPVQAALDNFTVVKRGIPAEATGWWRLEPDGSIWFTKRFPKQFVSLGFSKKLVAQMRDLGYDASYTVRDIKFTPRRPPSPIAPPKAEVEPVAPGVAKELWQYVESFFQETLAKGEDK